MEFNRMEIRMWRKNRNGNMGVRIQWKRRMEIRKRDGIS